MTKSIAFVSWDGPNVTYLEGLFLPIFIGLRRKYGYQFHVLHFCWNMPEQRLSAIKAICERNEIQYHLIEVTIKPIAFIGKLKALFFGPGKIKDYIDRHDIGVVMPRSTMPARMILKALSKKSPVRIVFDADGLPIEERVEFAGLQKGSARYRKLKETEGAVLRRADLVLTRTHRAAQYLSGQHDVSLDKFHVVINGRDANAFRMDAMKRSEIRSRLGISASDCLLVYCGSVGPQYGFDQMLTLHEKLSHFIAVHLLLLVNDPRFTPGINSEEQKSRVHVMKVSHDEIPSYLSAADVGLAIRKNSFSMQGVAPVKIAEYLLCGLPTIASADVGDADTMLKNESFAFLIDDYEAPEYDKMISWIISVFGDHELRDAARKFGEHNFALDASVDAYHKAIRLLP